MAAAAAPPNAAQKLAALEQCLNVCGVTTQAKINGITVREEYESLDNFAELQSCEEVQDMLHNFSRRRTGTIHYTTRDVKALKAHNWWLRDRIARNLPP